MAEQHDEWTAGHRYLDLDVLVRSRLTLITGDAADTAKEEASSR